MQADSADGVNYEWLLCALVARAGGTIRLTPSELVRWGLGTRLRMSFEESAPNVVLQLDEKTSLSFVQRRSAPDRSPAPPTPPVTPTRYSYDFSPRRLAPPQLPVTHSYDCHDGRLVAVEKPAEKAPAPRAIGSTGATKRPGPAKRKPRKRKH